VPATIGKRRAIAIPSGAFLAAGILLLETGTNVMIERSDAKTQEAAQNLLVFDVGEQTCALPLDAVVEILPMASLSRLPGAPSILEGFLNLGGTAIPVLRISRLLEAPFVQIGLYTPLIIVRQANARLGLLVSGIRQIAASSQCAAMVLAGHGMVENGVNLDGKIVPILSMETLLLEQERKRISDLQEVQQERLRELEEGYA